MQFSTVVLGSHTASQFLDPTFLPTLSSFTNSIYEYYPKDLLDFAHEGKVRFPFPLRVGGDYFHLGNGFHPGLYTGSVYVTLDNPEWKLVKNGFVCMPNTRCLLTVHLDDLLWIGHLPKRRSCFQRLMRMMEEALD